MISPSRQPRNSALFSWVVGCGASAPQTTRTEDDGSCNIGKTAQERCAKIYGGRKARQSGEFHAR
jgi:hypothetical protein